MCAERWLFLVSWRRWWVPRGWGRRLIRQMPARRCASFIKRIPYHLTSLHLWWGLWRVGKYYMQWQVWTIDSCKPEYTGKANQLSACDLSIHIVYYINMFVGRWVQRAEYGARKKLLNKQLGISQRYVVFCVSVSVRGKVSLLIDWSNIDSSWRDCWSIHLGTLWSPHPAPVFPLWGNGESLPYICVSHSIGKFGGAAHLLASFQGHSSLYIVVFLSLSPPISHFF